MKKALGNTMFYGHYKFQLDVQGTVDDPKGEKEFELPLELRLWIKDESLKKPQGGNKAGGNKHKG